MLVSIVSLVALDLKTRPSAVGRRAVYQIEVSVSYVACDAWLGDVFVHDLDVEVFDKGPQRVGVQGGLRLGLYIMLGCMLLALATLWPNWSARISMLYIPEPCGQHEPGKVVDHDDNVSQSITLISELAEPSEGGTGCMKAIPTIALDSTSRSALEG